MSQATIPRLSSGNRGKSTASLRSTTSWLATLKVSGRPPLDPTTRTLPSKSIKNYTNVKRSTTLSTATTSSNGSHRLVPRPFFPLKTAIETTPLALSRCTRPFKMPRLLGRRFPRAWKPCSNQPCLPQSSCVRLTNLHSKRKSTPSFQSILKKLKSAFRETTPI